MIRPRRMYDIQDTCTKEIYKKNDDGPAQQMLGKTTKHDCCKVSLALKTSGSSERTEGVYWNRGGRELELIGCGRACFRRTTAVVQHFLAFYCLPTRGGRTNLQIVAAAGLVSR